MLFLIDMCTQYSSH